MKQKEEKSVKCHICDAEATEVTYLCRECHDEFEQEMYEQYQQEMFANDIIGMVTALYGNPSQYGLTLNINF